MKTVIKSIRPTSVPEEFVVDVLIEGAEKSFLVRAVVPDLVSIEPLDRDFLKTFQYSMAPRKIATLVIRAYKGESATFPIDLGDL